MSSHVGDVDVDVDFFESVQDSWLDCDIHMKAGLGVQSIAIDNMQSYLLYFTLSYSDPFA